MFWGSLLGFSIEMAHSHLRLNRHAAVNNDVRAGHEAHIHAAGKHNGAGNLLGGSQTAHRLPLDKGVQGFLGIGGLVYPPLEGGRVYRSGAYATYSAAMDCDRATIAPLVAL